MSSHTAYWIAAARARESARPDRLFDDPYAEALAGERGRLILERSEQASGQENAFLPVRTRYFDDVLLEWAMRSAPAQVVLLGAGLDTRAFRLPLPAGTRVYEVDQADVLDHKDATLAGLGAAPICRRDVVRADLSEPWDERLLAVGFDRLAPTIWLAEGLFFYLSAHAVGELLRQTAELSAPGSVFAADIFGTGLLSLPGMTESMRLRAEQGLPPPFCTDRPTDLFTAAGWQPPMLVSPGMPPAGYGRFARNDAAARANPTMRTYLATADL